MQSESCDISHIKHDCDICRERVEHVAVIGFLIFGADHKKYQTQIMSRLDIKQISHKNVWFFWFLCIWGELSLDKH